MEGRSSAVSFILGSTERGALLGTWPAGSPHHSVIVVGRVLEEVESSEQAAPINFLGKSVLPVLTPFQLRETSLGWPSNQTDRAIAFEDTDFTAR